MELTPTVESTAMIEPPPPVERSTNIELRLDGVVLDGLSLRKSPMLPYLRMLLGVIEGIRLTCPEVVRLLQQGLRQRSIGARRRIDYVLGFLHEHPP